MKTFKQFISESKDADLQNVIDWLASIDSKARQPRGLKKEFQELQQILSVIDTAKGFNSDLFKIPDGFKDSIIMPFNRLGPEGRAKLEAKLSKNDKNPTTIKGKHAVYRKEDAAAYSKFTDAVKMLDSFLAKVKSGIHKKALKNLTIVFAKKSVLRGKASYKRDKDELWINLAAVSKAEGEKYASLPYVVMHELGHRYLTKNRQNWDYDSSEWSTTKYSMVDSMSGEERFAELFALSYWSKNYPEYTDKIKKFNTQVK